MHFTLFLVSLASAVQIGSVVAAPIVRHPVARDVPEKPAKGIAMARDTEFDATWYQKRGNPVHKLFKREDFPAVGSDEWKQGFPKGQPNPNDIPQSWKDALQAAIDGGKIPDIPLTNGDGKYPDGKDAAGKDICSSIAKCRGDGDVWDAPEGKFGIAFDNGPQPASEKLNSFLDEKDIPSTHFMIGSNILQYPDIFQKTFSLGGDIALHAFTHRRMTSLSNEDIVAEIGYAMQIIHKSTEGRVAKFWRPPYGDCDNRVRALAKEIFGLRAIFWNKDTDDWMLPSGKTTAEKVEDKYENWLNGDKKTGLIAVAHELSDQSVQSFIDAYTEIQKTDWKLESLVRLVDDSKSAYRNANGNTGDVTPMDIILNSSTPSNTTTTTDDTDEDDVDAKFDGKSKKKNNGAFSTAVGGTFSVLVTVVGVIAGISIL